MDTKKVQINNTLLKVDWMNVLDGKDSNANFDKFNNKLNQIMDDMSIKTIHISGKRCYTEPWMSRGLEVLSKRKIKLYKQSIMANSTKLTILILKNYRNVYNMTKREMKIIYYSNKITGCEKNRKKLWQIPMRSYAKRNIKEI